MEQRSNPTFLQALAALAEDEQQDEIARIAEIIASAPAAERDVALRLLLDIQDAALQRARPN